MDAALVLFYFILFFCCQNQKQKLKLVELCGFLSFAAKQNSRIMCWKNQANWRKESKTNNAVTMNEILG